MQLPVPCLTCSPTARSRRREFLSLSPCNAAEVSVFARTPSSGKAPSPLQVSHLQTVAGKRSDFGKAETWSAASHSGRGVRASRLRWEAMGCAPAALCESHAPGQQRLFGKGWRPLNSSST